MAGRWCTADWLANKPAKQSKYVPTNSFKPIKYAHFGQGKVPILSLEALHQLDIFIFNLAVTHVVLSLLTFVVGVAQVLELTASVLYTMTNTLLLTKDYIVM